MAFTSNVTVRGRIMRDAYVRLQIARVGNGEICVIPQAWEDRETRIALPDQPYLLPPVSMQMDMQLDNSNPLDYGYQLLEASGEFPDATWNV